MGANASMHSARSSGLRPAPMMVPASMMKTNLYIRLASHLCFSKILLQVSVFSPMLLRTPHFW